jgi:hypothetical protein
LKVTSLSLLIPARNERWLARTVADALAHIEADTDIWVVLDGNIAMTDGPLPFETLPADLRLHVITHADSIGQRAATNEMARATDAKYLMKVDAHCAFDQGFDRILLADMQDDWTCVPIMRNLHVFNWVCANGHTRYQGPSAEKCAQCGAPEHMDVVWIPKTNPSSTSYCFDSEPHFQYFNDFKKRPEGRGDITESMSLQGSAFMLSRERYFALDVCNEDFGSWGSQGIEVACKTWLSGGRVMCNHKTWYGHMFRTQGGDFSFPYEMSGRQQERAKKHARNLFFGNRWPGQVRPLSWLVQRFWPVPGWTDEQLAELKAHDGRLHGEPVKGIIYYTDSQLPAVIRDPVVDQLMKVAVSKNLPIVTVALKRRLHWGSKNIVFPTAKRGPATMFKQIVAALEHSTADVVFFCEHDVLYNPSHFDFTPPDRKKIYYDLNLWQARYGDGHAVYWDAKRVSQLCGYRDVLLAHYRKRLELVEANGYSMAMGYEPGSHHRAERVDDLRSDVWRSEVPNVDIKHGGNLSPAKWQLADFRTPPVGWREADSVPGWNGALDFLKVTHGQ